MLTNNRIIKHFIKGKPNNKNLDKVKEKISLLDKNFMKSLIKIIKLKKGINKTLNLKWKTPKNFHSKTVDKPTITNTKIKMIK